MNHTEDSLLLKNIKNSTYYYLLCLIFFYIMEQKKYTATREIGIIVAEAIGYALAPVIIMTLVAGIYWIFFKKFSYLFNIGVRILSSLLILRILIKAGII